MTLREYLITCDEFERTLILANIARRCPNYDSYSPSQKKKALEELSKILDEEIGDIEAEKNKVTNREVGFFINWENVSRKRMKGVEK